VLLLYGHLLVTSRKLPTTRRLINVRLSAALRAAAKDGNAIITAVENARVAEAKNKRAWHMTHAYGAPAKSAWRRSFFEVTESRHFSETETFAKTGVKT